MGFSRLSGLSRTCSRRYRPQGWLPNRCRSDRRGRRRPTLRGASSIIRESVPLVLPPALIGAGPASGRRTVHDSADQPCDWKGEGNGRKEQKGRKKTKEQDKEEKTRAYGNFPLACRRGGTRARSGGPRLIMQSTGGGGGVLGNGRDSISSPRRHYEAARPPPPPSPDRPCDVPTDRQFTNNKLKYTLFLIFFTVLSRVPARRLFCYLGH